MDSYQPNLQQKCIVMVNTRSTDLQHECSNEEEYVDEDVLYESKQMQKNQCNHVYYWIVGTFI